MITSAGSQKWISSKDLVVILQTKTAIDRRLRIQNIQLEAENNVHVQGTSPDEGAEESLANRLHPTWSNVSC